MKKYIFIICAIALFSGCVKDLEDESIFHKTEYIGRVIYTDGTPVPGLDIKVTNGTTVHNSTKTDDDGKFSLVIDADKIDGDYYIILSNGLIEKKSSPVGFGKEIYDYQDVIFCDKNDLLPEVVTSYITGATQASFTCGGNITNTKGQEIKERGICWGLSSIPTIDNSADHTIACGYGDGAFSTIINNVNLQSGNYYVRAYAKGDFGVSYGDARRANHENLEYEQLPTVMFGGLKYHIYPDMGEMTWATGYAACENLVYAGYDDWYLPSREEFYHIYINTSEEFLPSNQRYWSSDAYNSDGSVHYRYYNGWDGGSNYNTFHIVPVRHD